MELNGPQKAPAKSLWHVVRAVYYMVLKGLWKRSVAVDLQLLFKRGKIAGGRALSGLLTAHHHHHHGKTAAFDVAAFSSAFSCRSMDPTNAVYAPLEVEFSCSNTPSFPYFHRKGQHHHHRRHHHPHHHHHHHHRSSSSSSSSSSSRRDSTLYNYDAAAIAKVFEVLNSDSSASTSGASVDVARSPRRARQPLRVTDSPFSTAEEEEEDDDDLEEGLEVGGGGGGGVDREAENFIRWFKEQLRTQTPESEYGDHWL